MVSVCHSHHRQQTQPACIRQRAEPPVYASGCQSGLGGGHHLHSHPHSGWLYLAAVLDLFSHKIVGWAMAPNMPAELVCSVLQMALCQRQPASDLIVHSDRGSQYASQDYRDLLQYSRFAD